MLRFTMSLLIAAMGTCVWAHSSVADEVIPDPQLKQAIQKILKKKQIEKEQIDPADLKTIYFFDGHDLGIENLTGLEHCTNLAELKLNGNKIHDLTPLSGLKNIQSLTLSKNQIKDLTPLKDLTKIQYLEIEENQIESLAGLEEMKNLRALYAEQNKIADLSPLKNAERLTSLNLNDNNVEDLSPIKHLRWVDLLGLKNNKVRDFTPIAEWKNLHMTFLEGLPLEDLSVLVKMAKQDYEGEKRFAPFWFLYLDVDTLPESAKAQIEELKTFGVRINRRD